jgi:hypothetical protein
MAVSSPEIVIEAISLPFTVLGGLGAAATIVLLWKKFRKPRLPIHHETRNVEDSVGIEEQWIPLRDTFELEGDPVTARSPSVC